MNSQSSEDILTLSEKYLNRRVALWQGLSDTPPSPDSLLSAKPYNTNLASKHHPPLFCTQLFSTLQRSQFCASAVQPGANLQKFAEPRVLASDWSRKSRDRCTRQCWPLIGRLVSGQKCTLQNETAGLKTFKAISSVYRCGISTKSCVSCWPGLCAVFSVQLRGLTLPLFARSTTCRFSDVSVARSNSNIHTAHFFILIFLSSI